MSKKLLMIGLGLVMSFLVNAQSANRRICGSMDNLQQQMAADPGLAARMQQIENQTAAYLAAHKNQNSTNAVITIPVVFHVVYNTAAQNISDLQITEQINQLNLDYARLNTDASNTPSVWQSLAINTNIQFCLAQQDPNGNPSTGIERKQTSTTSFSTNNAVKSGTLSSTSGGLNAWNSSNYLNIWSCNLSGGVLGYAQFPGGAASTDGVVLLYSSIGSMLHPGTASPYNLGRTATHEVGHWLNLYHIWGDDGTACSGTDNVSDTPNQAGENYGAPTFPHTDACTSTSPGVMFMNYMDYTDDNAMNMFTAGQVARMQALFATGGARAAMLNSGGCNPGTTTCGTPSGLTVGTVGTTTAALSWTAVSGATSYSVQYKLSSSATWTTTTSATNSITLSGLTSASAYNWQVSAVCTSGSSAFAAGTNFTTASTTTCNAPSGLTVGTVGTTTAALSWTAVSGATSYSVQYKLSSSATWTTTTSATNSITLSGLTSASIYNWQVSTTCSGGSSAYTAGTNFTTATVTTCNAPTGLTVGTVGTSSAALSWTAVSGATSYSVQYKLSSSATWTTTTSATNSITLSGLSSSSVYNWQVSTTCSGGSSAYTAGTNFTTGAVSGCSDTWESNNTSTTAKTISTNTDITGLISSATDYDWFKFTTTSPNTKVKVTLTNLPLDYDIRLYNSGLSLLATSQNGGTTSESIIRNVTTATTYYVRVYGYNGAFSTTSCYTLRASVSSTNFRTMEDVTLEEATSEVNELMLFPNPTNGEVNVIFNSSVTEEASVRIFDMVGKTVLTQNVALNQDNNKFSFDLSNMTKGIYFLELNTSAGRIVKKIVLEK